VEPDNSTLEVEPWQTELEGVDGQLVEGQTLSLEVVDQCLLGLALQLPAHLIFGLKQHWLEHLAVLAQQELNLHLEVEHYKEGYLEMAVT